MDPLFERTDMACRKLLLRRHVRVTVLAKEIEQPRLGRLAGSRDGAVAATLEDGFP